MDQADTNKWICPRPIINVRQQKLKQLTHSNLAASSTYHNTESAGALVCLVQYHISALPTIFSPTATKATLMAVRVTNTNS